MNKPLRFAVIGQPVSHSLSPKIHHFFAKQTNRLLHYDLIEGQHLVFEQQVSDFFKGNGKGLNVTLPFKHRAYAMADVKTSRSQAAKAANTLWMQDNLLHADNTDGIGLIRDFNRYLSLNKQHILILGAGGAARGILPSLLAAQPASLTVANRTITRLDILKKDFPGIHYTTLTHITGAFNIIINATSASLQGHSLALPDAVISNKPFCYDLAYDLENPTSFMVYVKNAGCSTVDGIGMLVEQAAESFFIWHQVMPDTVPVLARLGKRVMDR